MALYDALKANKGLPVSDSYAALWGKSAAESSIKTLTGRLPLFFRTSENKLRDWVIYGNNEPGKNLISVEDTAGQDPQVTITRQDEQTGSIEAATTSGTTYRQIYWYPEFEEGQTYIFSTYVNEINQHARIAFRKKSNDQIITSRWFNTAGAKTLQFTYTSEAYPEGVYVALILNDSAATEGEINVSKLMLRKANTSEAFEPYQIGVGEKTENGYVLNIGVGYAPNIEHQYPAVPLFTRKAINLGENPLTEGQTLSMSEFGDIAPNTRHKDLFIAAFEGFDYDSQLSYNQPEMMIKYKE